MLANSHRYQLESDNRLQPMLDVLTNNRVISPEERQFVIGHYTSQNGRQLLLNMIMGFQQTPGVYPYRDDITEPILVEFIKNYINQVVTAVRNSMAQQQNNGMLNNAFGAGPTLFGNAGMGNIPRGNSIFANNTGMNAGGSFFKNAVPTVTASPAVNLYTSPAVTPPVNVGKIISAKEPIAQKLDEGVYPAYAEPVMITEYAKTFGIKSAISSISATFKVGETRHVDFITCKLFHGQTNAQAAIDAAVKAIPIRSPLFGMLIYYNEYLVVPGTTITKLKTTLNNIKKVLPVNDISMTEAHLAYLDKLDEVLADEPSGIANIISQLIVDQFMFYTKTKHLSPMEETKGHLKIDTLSDIKQVLALYAAGKLDLPKVEAKDFPIRLMAILDQSIPNFIHNLIVYTPDQIDEIIMALGDQIYTEEYSARDYWKLKMAETSDKKSKPTALEELVKRINSVSVIGIPRAVLYTNVMSPGVFDFTEHGDLVPRLIKAIYTDTEFVINEAMKANDRPEELCLKGLNTSHTFGQPIKMIIEADNKQIEGNLGMVMGDVIFVSEK